MREKDQKGSKETKKREEAAFRKSQKYRSNSFERSAVLLAFISFVGGIIALILSTLP